MPDGRGGETAHRPGPEAVPRGTDKRKLADASPHSDPARPSVGSGHRDVRSDSAQKVGKDRPLPEAPRRDRGQADPFWMCTQTAWSRDTAALCPDSRERGRLLMNSVQAGQLVAGEQTLELHLPPRLLRGQYIEHGRFISCGGTSSQFLLLGWNFPFSNHWTSSDENFRREGSNAFFCLSCPLPNIYQTPAAYSVLDRL